MAPEYFYEYSYYEHDGERMWMKDGWLHRDDGPAYMEDDYQYSVWATDGYITKVTGGKYLYDPPGTRGWLCPRVSSKR
jgi:hypothetical protein